ncbi:alpha/beta-hydrolase [Schizopora paradoxa]|uniref:Alpha/beta-hydrolase n=1 Tax=Schizopora paradoxa TaxID=27342 RepID=A0A0H2RWN2_9AGAM|nr:alpha/beta-hydrolase [Schizopora paradoxa]
MKYRPLFLLNVLPFFAVATASILGDFHPSTYPKKVAKCEALHRPDSTIKMIDIHYVDINPSASKTIIMVHGWPSLWSSWSNQILEFQDQYHLIALDQRGFGSSTHPGDVESSGTMGDLVGDLVCVLQDAGVETAICLGHDWGSQVCYEAARMRPDIFEGVVGAVVPYIPAAGNFTPTAALVHLLPRLTYQLFFEVQTPAAVDELNKDVRRTLRATLLSADTPPPEAFLTSKDSFLHGWEDVSEIDPIPFFSQEEEDYFVEQLSIQGFANTLQFYTKGNKYASWDFSHSQGNHTIPQPALAILPTEDPVADWEKASQLLHSAHFLPNLKVETMRAAHWPQLEDPRKFNGFIRDWLDVLAQASALAPEEKHGHHIADEL